MIWKLRDILDLRTAREVVPGVWVTARPDGDHWPARLRGAWAVLLGRADAFTWPTYDDPRSWCMVPDAGRFVTMKSAAAAAKGSKSSM